MEKLDNSLTVIGRILSGTEGMIIQRGHRRRENTYTHTTIIEVDNTHVMDK